MAIEGLFLTERLHEEFQHKVERAFSLGNVETSDSVKVYVVGLLGRMRDTDSLYMRQMDTTSETYQYRLGEMASQTLALMHSKAKEMVGTLERGVVYAHAGDYALFISGVFPETLHHLAIRRGHPGIEYFQNMGSASYQLAGSHWGETLYGELSEKFKDISDSLQAVFCQGSGAEKLLNLLERYAITGSKAIQEVLASEKILLPTVKGIH